MVREKAVDRNVLMKEYPEINPILADRVLTSSGRMGRSGITQVGKEFRSYTGFRLLMNAYVIRMRGEDTELAALALETAERISVSLPGEEGATAREALARLFPSGHRKSSAAEERVEPALSAVAETRQSDNTGIRVEAEGNAPAVIQPMWKILSGFEKLGRAGSRAEAEELLGRAVAIIRRMESCEAQRVISEIEERTGRKETAAVLLKIMQTEERQDVVAKARVHLFYCLPEIGGELCKVANNLRDHVDDEEALEILGALLEGKESEAMAMLLENYPKIWIEYALPILDAPPEFARENIELVKKAVDKAGGHSTIVKIMDMLDLGSREDRQRNLATVLVESLNGCGYASAAMAIEQAGMKATEKGVGLLKFIIEDKRTHMRVKEAAARALGLTGREEAVDVAEDCLNRWGKGDEAIRSAAYNSLCKLFFIEEPRIEQVIAVGAKDEKEDPRIRLELIRWLGENGTRIGVCALQNILGKCEDEKLMLAASKALEKLSEESARRSLPVPGRGSKPTISAAPPPRTPAPHVSITPIKRISGEPGRRSQGPRTSSAP